MIKAILLTAFAGCTCVACFDDESPNASDYTYEFKVEKLECITDVYLGHPANVSLTITSDKDAENIPVDFSLSKHLSDAELDGGTGEVTQYSAGSYIIPTITKGKNSYPVRITVPSHNIDAGVYDIIPIVDPGHIMSRERAECVSSGNVDVDQKKECITEDLVATVNVKRDFMESPDLLVENVLLTSDVMTINPNDSNPDYLSGTVTVTSVAKDMLNVPVRFVLEAGGIEYPMMIWDNDINGYVSDYMIGEMRKNMPKSFPFALTMDSAVVLSLASGKNTMTLKVKIDPDNTIAEAFIAGLSGGETNNTLSKEVTIINNMPSLYGFSSLWPSMVTVTPDSSVVKSDPPTSGLYFSKSFSQMVGNSTFGAYPNFSSWAALNEDGASGYTGGGVDILVFNQTFNFVSLESSVAAIPHRLSSSYCDFSLEYLGRVLYSFHFDGEYSWDKKWEIYKSCGYTARFFVGPIPMNVSAGAQGTLGFVVAFEVGDNLEVSAGPYAFAGAYASASIGIAGLLEGGLVGNMNIVNIEYKAIASAGMELSAGAKQIRGVLNEKVTMNLSGPNGTINLFVKYPTVKLCKIPWTRLKFPCGINMKKDEITIASFSSWSKYSILLDKTQTSPWINTGL